MTSIKTTNAQREYAARQARAKALIARLSAGLDAHAARAAGQPDNWGFSGDLGAVESSLQELVAGLGG